MPNENDPPEGLLYDLAYLNDMSPGDNEFITTMIQMFIEQIPVSVENMNAAYEKNDFVTLKSIAHGTKSSIDILGISSFQKEIKEIEMLAMQGKPDPRLDELMQLLNSTVPKAIQQLKEIV